MWPSEVDGEGHCCRIPTLSSRGHVLPACEVSGPGGDTCCECFFGVVRKQADSLENVRDA